MDSMQVYRGLDIGTAKPSLMEREGVRHHMIDLVDPEDEFSVAEFRALGRRVIEESQAAALIVTGGSGLHFRALVDPMSFAPTQRSLRAELENADFGELRSELLGADPDAAQHVDFSNSRRVIRAVEIYRLSGETPSLRARSAEAERVRRYESEIEFIAVGIDPGTQLEFRVSQRVNQMRSGGLFEEVAALRHRLSRTACSAVGYRELIDVVDGDEDEDTAFEAIAANTMRLAKKQRTWFHRDPRIRWIPWMEDLDARVTRMIEALDG